MSTFGSPGALPSTKPTPYVPRSRFSRLSSSSLMFSRPQRGSFPLDHDGECREVMKSYLSCMKKVRGVNEDECRDLAKSYLACRMDHNLMARDEFKNLGFAERPKPATPPAAGETAAAATAASEPEKGVKGELRW
ncbi:Cytochrome c oxidase assembly protein-like protein [Hapsidospora chrysogenum ATCC 11550]|uniref:Cytochrome c oxidase assembly protein-like protein n=1 Tax=Hapsidospora chrysogenum (strain ATCC 11550 / CBS 779.69 / DSM 880 / IAM 14645 / JCM 23072 / IMI 49137) TaxID=857340 RepID=A0A086SZZ4_HAPC1|nr:Cytochrome c oxidase assembly protein-like protein [Hapsidospora chrysogenum ATCC 11550]